MNIRNRILLGPVAAILLLVVFGIVAYWTISSQERAMQEINDVRFEHYRVSTAMSDRVNHAHLGMFRLVTWFQAYDQGTQERMIGEINQSLAAINADLLKLSKDEGFDGEEKQQINALLAQIGKYKQSAEAAIFMVKLDVTSALGDMKTVEGNYQQLAKAFAELNGLEQRLSLNTYNAARTASNQALTFNLIVLLAAIVIAAVIGLTTAQKLMQQLGGEPADAVEIAGRIAAGNLTVKVPNAPKGSLMEAMEAMRCSLRNMIGHMTEHSSELSSASTQLAGASRSVAQSSLEQNDAAASMAASIEQMSASINSVSENSQQAAAVSTASGETAESGAEVILGASLEMETIASSVNHVAASIKELGNQAERISSVVTVIREVADQTNLLALNAAIEAARAGEQGRGFAVVADEVRKLAERTAKSTHEIGDMISIIQHSASEAVGAMHDTVRQAEHGLSLAHGAGSAVGNIKEGATQVVAAVSSITTALAEQASVTQSIAQHVERIARMSEENNNRAAESADAANHLQHLAQAMRQQVGQFHL